MKINFKRIVSILLCVCLCVALANLPVSAEQKPLASYDVEWYNPNSVKSIQKNEKTFNFRVNFNHYFAIK